MPHVPRLWRILRVMAAILKETMEQTTWTDFFLIKQEIVEL